LLAKQQAGAHAVTDQLDERRDRAGSYPMDDERWETDNEQRTMDNECAMTTKFRGTVGGDTCSETANRKTSERAKQASKQAKLDLESNPKDD
jgi:hypothetical protein